MLVIEKFRNLGAIILFVVLLYPTVADPAEHTKSSGVEDSENSGSNSTIGVVGVTSSVKKPEYRDKQIGFGIDAYIAEELGKTNLFRFLEDDQSIIERIKGIQEKIWLLRDEIDKAGLVRLSDETECDVLAYGRVLNMKEHRERTFAGPANIIKKIGEVKIEVCLYIKETGEVLTATGKGKSSKGLWGFITQGRAEALDFDDYMIGQASKEAVKEAIKELMEKYQARIGMGDNEDKKKKEVRK